MQRESRHGAPGIDDAVKTIYSLIRRRRISAAANPQIPQNHTAAVPQAIAAQRNTACSLLCGQESAYAAKAPGLGFCGGATDSSPPGQGGA